MRIQSERALTSELTVRQSVLFSLLIYDLLLCRAPTMQHSCAPRNRGWCLEEILLIEMILLDSRDNVESSCQTNRSMCTHTHIIRGRVTHSQLSGTSYQPPPLCNAHHTSPAHFLSLCLSLSFCFSLCLSLFLSVFLWVFFKPSSLTCCHSYWWLRAGP